MAGPLTGVRVIELAGLGALSCGSLRLADMGAEVIRVERHGDVLAETERTPKPYSSWDRAGSALDCDRSEANGRHRNRAAPLGDGRRVLRCLPARCRRATRHRSRRGTRCQTRHRARPPYWMGADGPSQLNRWPFVELRGNYWRDRCHQSTRWRSGAATPDSW